MSNLTEVVDVAAVPPGMDADEFRRLSEVVLEDLGVDPFVRAGWRFVAAAADADVPGLRAVYRAPDGRVSIEGASVVIRFSDEIDAQVIDRVLDGHRLKVHRQLGFVPRGFQVKLIDPPRRGQLVKISEELEGLECISYADPDLVEFFDQRLA